MDNAIGKVEIKTSLFHPREVAATGDLSRTNDFANLPVWCVRFSVLAPFLGSPTLSRRVRDPPMKGQQATPTHQHQPTNPQLSS